MADPVETTRLGRSYFQCPACPWSGMNRESVATHMQDHLPRPTLDEILHPAPAPASEPEAEPAIEPAIEDLPDPTDDEQKE